MSIFLETVKAARKKDIVEQAIEETCAKHAAEEEEETGAASCKQYMSPSRANDFAKTIAGLMDKGASYGDAKAQAFDDTEMPPPKSPCCNFIRSKVAELRKNTVKESVGDNANDLETKVKTLTRQRDKYKSDILLHRPQLTSVEERKIKSMTAEITKAKRALRTAKTKLEKE